MRSKWGIIFMLGFTLFLLTGCNEVEDILAKVNQLLDEQLEQSDSTDQEINHAEEEMMGQGGPAPTDENELETTNEVSIPTQSQSIEEQLAEAGYQQLDPPNGLPFEVPRDWILVEDNSGDPQAENYDGLFCFETPTDVQELAEQVAQPVEQVSHEHFGEDQAIVHRTSLAQESDYEEWYGELAYFHESSYSCAYLTIWFGPYEVHEQYGEDPDTMVSEDELP